MQRCSAVPRAAVMPRADDVRHLRTAQRAAAAAAAAPAARRRSEQPRHRPAVRALGLHVAVSQQQQQVQRWLPVPAAPVQQHVPQRRRVRVRWVGHQPELA
eukprot:142391-Prymnesium_polylepis.1